MPSGSQDSIPYEDIYVLLGCFVVLALGEFLALCWCIDMCVRDYLPFSFRRKKNSDGKDEDDRGAACVVCSTEKEGKISKQLSNCKHGLHVDCIARLLRMNLKCPICKPEAEPKAHNKKQEPASSAMRDLERQ